MPATVIGIFGYRWIHRVMQVTVVIVGLSMIIMLIQGLRFGSLPAKETTMTAPTAGLFLAGAALLVIDMLSWAPFVSDYTRYLPVNTSGRRLFWTIYLRQRRHDDHLVHARRVPRRLAAEPVGRSPRSARSPASGRWSCWR